MFHINKSPTLTFLTAPALVLSRITRIGVGIRVTPRKVGDLDICPIQIGESHQ